MGMLNSETGNDQNCNEILGSKKLSVKHASEKIGYWPVSSRYVFLLLFLK